MSQRRSQCSTCALYVSGLSSESGLPSCEAFPAGIPNDIFTNQYDHRQPYTGDNGVRWTSDGGPFPTEAFAPAALGRGRPMGRPGSTADPHLT